MNVVTRPAADAPSAIAAAIHINVITAAMLLVQPAFVQALVERGGYDERGAGYVASAEMFGVAFGAALLAFAGSRVDWRRGSFVALGIMTLAGAASALLLVSPWFWLARLLVGAGSGVAMSISFSSVGASSHPDRHFAWLITCALVFGAVVVFAMPSLLASLGLGGLLWLLTAYYATGATAVRWLPPRVQAATPSGISSVAEPTASTPPPVAEIGTTLRWLAIAAMFFYYIAQGAVWSYLALMGTARGLDGAAVSSGLTVSQLAGLAAVMLAAALAGRIAREIALGLGIAAGMVALWLLLGPQTALVYGSLVSAFNGAWNWCDPFLLGTMASVDSTGRVMTWAIAWRLLGLALGPLLAALLVSGQDFTRVNLLGMATLALSLACIVPPLIALRRTAAARLTRR